MKKCVELQVATKPCGSSISASSAPAVYAWMHAVMSLSLLCELSFGSRTSGPGRRTCTVNKLMPRSTTAVVGDLYSGMIDDGGRPDRYPRVLVRRALHAARHHQADVDAVDHAVGLKGAVELVGEICRRHPDVERDRRRTLVEPPKMAIEECRVAIVDAKPLPHAVAEHEACVEHRDDGLGARPQLAVDRHEDAVVSWIVDVLMGSVRLVSHRRVTALLMPRRLPAGLSTEAGMSAVGGQRAD